MQLLTVPQVAQVCALHERTIRKLIATGELPSVKVGNSRRIPEDALRAYVADRLAVQS